MYPPPSLYPNVEESFLSEKLLSNLEPPPPPPTVLKSPPQFTTPPPE